MRNYLRWLNWRIRWQLKQIADATAGRLVLSLLRLMRRFDRVRMSDRVARLMRRIGPWLPEHRIGRANLVAAFPDKSAAEIETILAGVWDNLGRVAVEFAFLDRIAEGDPLRRTNIDYDERTIERFKALRDDGKPALIFAAHLANWELPAIVAAADGLDTIVLYRRPNMGKVADAVLQVRQGSMGTLIAAGLETPVKIARALEAGQHAGMLVDQHHGRGVEVTFFGRRCKVNPLLAMLARQVECPIHGARVMRLPNGRFDAEITDAVEPARDAEGKVDVQGTMQRVTDVVEGWVREHPDQWLWLHRRWR